MFVSQLLILLRLHQLASFYYQTYFAFMFIQCGGCVYCLFRWISAGSNLFGSCCTPKPKCLKLLLETIPVIKIFLEGNRKMCLTHETQSFVLIKLTSWIPDKTRRESQWGHFYLFQLGIIADNMKLFHSQRALGLNIWRTKIK